MGDENNGQQQSQQQGSNAGGDQSNTNNNPQNQNQNSGNQSNPANGNGGETGTKTFTQDELSAVAATEKRQGKQSILNLFGVKTEKEAKEQAEAFKKWQESQKDAEQKLKDAQTAVTEAQQKAQAAEMKLACITAGVQKDSVDDILAIAATKVTDDKDLNAVLEEMKKDPKYKGFFGTSSSSGTGSPAGHQGTGGGSNENLGEKLGKKFAAAPKKSNFFKH